MSNVAEWIRQDLEELKDDPEFLTEVVLVEINEIICELMEKQNVSRAELARRLGWRRSAVTKLLQGKHNISVERLQKVAVALGHRLTTPRFEPLVSHLRLKIEAGSSTKSTDYTQQGRREINFEGVQFHSIQPETA